MALLKNHNSVDNYFTILHKSYCVDLYFVLMIFLNQYYENSYRDVWFKAFCFCQIKRPKPH